MQKYLIPIIIKSNLGELMVGTDTERPYIIHIGKDRYHFLLSSENTSFQHDKPSYQQTMKFPSAKIHMPGHLYVKIEDLYEKGTVTVVAATTMGKVHITLNVGWYSCGSSTLITKLTRRPAGPSTISIMVPKAGRAFKID